ncbi:hypothetical protein HG536_0F03030 [Torulaspora globosa]|uniref:Ubiquitin-related modifier 1 n=1 Tax=Torulaspora globosa TaxID=48254 RepID=A0A7G3ZKE2_9SACH|nr:uncharacterized protein HG536_0F03030 [Torulaspora globosa]QLL33978.1 hypothetical protein HG536_0F03030 [Torulaspora globosa]
MVSVTVEFLGGLDVIVNKQRIHQVQIDEEGVDMKRLISYIADQMITNKNDVEVFLEDGSVRPGILTLINDTDWELEGGEGYLLEDKDVISFTSTLHGG